MRVVKREVAALIAAVRKMRRWLGVE